MACFLSETSPCLHLECDQCWQTKQALSSQIHRMYVATLRAIQVGIFCFQITLHVHVVSLRVLMRHVSVSVVGILEFCQLKTLCWIVCAIFRKHVIFLRRRFEKMTNFKANHLYFSNIKNMKFEIKGWSDVSFNCCPSYSASLGKVVHCIAKSQKGEDENRPCLLAYPIWF